MSPASGPPVLPMMAAVGPMPSGADWSYEMKWDGIRVIAEVDEGVCRLWSRNSRDVSGGYPELLGLANAPGLVLPAVLDGEIVTLDENGAPSFGLLQRRMHVRDPRHLAQLINQVPVSVRVFDVLTFDGKSLLDATYDDRRGLLDSLDIGDPFWEVPPAYADGDEALELSASTGLEGVVAKRRRSRYLPGKRSHDWVKVKPIQTRDVILCGWHPGEGNRAGRIGSLYCGAYTEPGGELVLIGKVGSGLDFAMLEVLSAELAALEIDRPPFDASSVPTPDRRAAHWLDPLLVAEVAFSGWAGDGRLRHPVWRGLRLDIDPESVVL
ncbi:non-homologous end-joining DNA ligase [Kribbella sp. VKM Ac-2568]|uniref:non-homologous end-joining DNA ligase n=1 Tax=Kribbella sp. VKM Ac-2568 TaxID=2512219 RepID=UPI0010E2C8E5|nr:non-homologous end-joining DNA ligase [Kribbella sp. VKM Ac-2568]TCM41226.1 bifunctional non-homologous end joining protein LigD [Kribbella sp. VKM Ac-2568]